MLSGIRLKSLKIRGEQNCFLLVQLRARAGALMTTARGSYVIRRETCWRREGEGEFQKLGS